MRKIERVRKREIVREREKEREIARVGRKREREIV